MPLVHRYVKPVHISNTKLTLSKSDSEFIAVNNGTLVNVLRQLASLVNHAGDIFFNISILTGELGTRIRNVKLRLDELEVKTELFDPKLVPVPEGSLDKEDGPIPYKIRDIEPLDKDLFLQSTRPPFILKLYEDAGKHEPNIPKRSPIIINYENGGPGQNIHESETFQRTASISTLRDWKLDDYVDEKIATLTLKNNSTSAELSFILAKPFPSTVVSVDVTGSIFDRMKANRRSLVIHTKRIRLKNKRRNTICGSMPNKECGIQTSLSSVTSPKADTTKKYGIDSGHWSSSCTSSAREGYVEARSSSSVLSPWDPNSLSTSSDCLFDDEDRSLTPQLENFTDGMVSDSDSVDTEGYFTSFRNECGFPKSKKTTKEKGDNSNSTLTTLENDYELFGKGSTSTTASSCGTVVIRSKPDPPIRTTSAEHLTDKKIHPQGEDAGWEERVKRKSLIERVPSIVVVTPSPSCSSVSPPPLKDPGLVLEFQESKSESTFKKMNEANQDSQSISGTLSDTDSDNRLEEYKDGSCSELMRGSSSSSTLSTTSSHNSTHTLTNGPTTLPQPDVIADVQQLVIRTKGTPKLDIGQQYFSLDTVLLGSSEEEHHQDRSSGESKMSLQSASSGKIRGARVVLDANGEIIFSSETLRRKRRHKVSFDPGNAVKPQGYDNGSTYSRIRESVYDRIRKESSLDNDKLYECIEEIRRHNLKESEAMLREKSSYDDETLRRPKVNGILSDENQIIGIPFVNTITNRPRIKSPSPFECPTRSVLLETDLDSAIPPIMPELKTLPKIKDRLKRNESYRIATDELPPRSPSSHSQIPSVNTRKMNVTNMNKKRDIPEEDPTFIQQVLSFGSSKVLSERNSPGDGLNRSVTLSKLALSPDDRPSFLRRESPPTMDEITKEIYRFRKKFNIQPNASSTKLCSSAFLNGTELSSTSLSRSLSSSSRQVIPKVICHGPKPPERKYFFSSPLSTSTPIKKSTSSSSTYNKHVPLPPVVPKIPQMSRVSPSILQNSIGNPYSATTRRLFSALKSNGGGSNDGTLPKSVSFLIPQHVSPSSFPASPSMPSTSSNTIISSFRSRTSLSDFKKLLQATKSNSKRNSISAVEILKPRLLGQETTL